MQSIGLFKRLIVMTYDALLLVAVAFFTSAVLMALFQWLAPSTFFVSSAGESKLMELSDLGRNVGMLIVCLNCLVVSFLFYGWFWTHGGQTLGMKAWNLYLIKPDGKFIDWQLAAVRYALALVSWAAFGLGFTWVLLNKRKLTWHDMLSNTQIVHQAPQPSKRKPGKKARS